MNISRKTPRPSTRLNRGNVVLANSRLIDPQPIKARFDAFVDVHRHYIEAHDKVAEAETLDRAELERIAQLNGAVERALAGLQAALLLDGEPRRNPFGRFAPKGPGQMSVLGFAEKVTAAESLVSTLRKSMGLSSATLAAADRLAREVARLREALPGWTMRRTFLAMARQERNTLGLQWDTAYRALRYMSLAVVESPGLHYLLFAQPKRGTRKGKVTEVPNTPVDAQPPDPPANHSTTQPAVAVTDDGAAAPSSDAQSPYAA